MIEKLRQHIEKLIPLTDEEFVFVAQHFSNRRYKKHQYIIQEGNEVKYHYFILKGLTKLVYTDDTAKEHIISFAMEDWWESDFQAFYTQTQATMALICLEDTDVLCLSLEGYKKLCDGLQKMSVLSLRKPTSVFWVLSGESFPCLHQTRSNVTGN